MSEADYRALQSVMTTLTTVYNCHPYLERRLDWNGKIARVLPLQAFTTQKAAVDRAVAHDRESEKLVRGWLTTDQKEFDKALAQHEETQRVMNLVDEDVCATTRDGKNLTFVVPADKLQQMKDAQIRALLEDDAATDATDKRSKPKKPATPIEVSVG